MEASGPSRRTWWRRLRSSTPRKRRVANAAAEEARLIVSSGELGLRHAAELTHPTAEQKPTEECRELTLAPVHRQPSLLRDALSYLASIIVAALLLAALMLFVLPRGGAELH